MSDEQRSRVYRSEQRLICVCSQGQVSDTLKRFAVKVTSSSVKERKEVLEELKECVKGKGEFIRMKK